MASAPGCGHGCGATVGETEDETTATFLAFALVGLLAASTSSLLVARLANRWESAVPLALFRIAYGSVLFFEVAQLLYYEHLITDPVPYFEPAEVRLTYLLWAWLVAIVCLVLGLFTRGAAVASYLCGLCTISVFHDFEYHVDYVMTGMNLLLVFAPIERRLSLDRLRATLRAAATGERPPAAEVSALYRKLIVLLGIAFVYFDSAFWKFSSPMWTSGLGVWLPAALPQVTWADYSPVLDVEWLVKGLGYTTLVVETLFIVLMWFEALSLPLAIVGLGLHLCITAVFPIPWFGLAVAAIYVLVLPPRLYRWLGRRLTVATPRLTFFYNEACPLCTRTRLVVQHFDLRGAVDFRGVRREAAQHRVLRGVPFPALLATVHGVDASGNILRGIDTHRRVASHVFPPLGWLLALPAVRQLAALCYRAMAEHPGMKACDADRGARPDIEPSVSAEVPGARVPMGRAVRVGLGLFVAVTVVCQAAAITQSPVFRSLSQAAGADVLARQLARYGASVTLLSRPLMGITSHGVFMDAHFRGYNHIVGIVYVRPESEVWLPITRPSGHAHWMNSGRQWVYWTWRCVGPNVQTDRLALGLKRETAFWMHQNGIAPLDATFRVLVKRIDVPTQWERGFLRRQQVRPWVEAGVATWKRGSFQATLKNIEAL